MSHLFYTHTVLKIDTMVNGQRTKMFNNFATVTKKREVDGSAGRWGKGEGGERRHKKEK